MIGIRRLPMMLVAAALLLAFWWEPASAFWGTSGSGQQDKSGLDLEQGYDRNTVVTISGAVAAPPRPIAGGLLAVELKLTGEQIVVVLGPEWYLQDDNLDWKIGEQVTARGSLAQGRDGRTYLLSQQITAPGGQTMVLRSENGSPSWSGRIRGERPGGLQIQRGGAGGRRGR